jgi:signal transduction histidine kinase
MRTPLTSLIGSAEMLMFEDNIDAKEQKMFVEFVHSGAKRLHDFFEKIMILSSLKSGKRSFNMAQDDLCEILREAISEVVSKASDRNIKIEEIFDINPIVCVDKREIKNIIVMILDNAIRFSPSDEIIKVCVFSENEDVCIKVIDNGGGIDPDYLPYVFEELSDPDVAHHSEGHGLSLAIARQIVLRHNGIISVESTKGSGTAFKVQLPVAVPSELVNCGGKK